MDVLVSSFVSFHPFLLLPTGFAFIVWEMAVSASSISISLSFLLPSSCYDDNAHTPLPPPPTTTTTTTTTTTDPEETF